MNGDLTELLARGVVHGPAEELLGIPALHLDQIGAQKPPTQKLGHIIILPPEHAKESGAEKAEQKIGQRNGAETNEALIWRNRFYRGGFAPHLDGCERAFPAN